MDSERLFPKSSKQEPSMWLDESLWGHRLYDEQTPWFIYLEFLNVYAYQKMNGISLEEPDGLNTLEYASPKRLYLRNLLFNYPFTRIESICKKHPSDNKRWELFLHDLLEAQQGISNANFDYLRENFDEFSDLVEVIRLVHGSCLELSSNKRWTSKFVFPYCEEALFEDLDKKAGSNDRRFFGRTGELLYLMFSRSQYRERLYLQIDEKLFPKNGMWSSILRALQPGKEPPREKKPAGFLPYRSHDRFDKIADDWLVLLQQPIPDIDRIHHLVTLTGLHMFLYQQEVSRLELSDSCPSYIVAEILAPKKTLVRELSIESYQDNNVLSLRAISCFIDKIEQSEDWQTAYEGQTPFDSCKEILKRKVLWPKRETDYEGSRNPDQLIVAFRESARKRHRQHIGNIHRVYGKEIGLISRRGTNRLRYAPNDSLLKTLILATVPRRMELGEFLEKIYTKYGIVIGDQAAEDMMRCKDGDLDKKAFQDNSTRLEQRLSSIGLLKRLSDACAYVINPYIGESNG